jgi:outer membrane protein OmpA-like peptidoglycan-associated protein
MMRQRMWLGVVGLLAIGCAGPAGMPGPQGQTGMTGPQGSTGSTGMTGSQGQPGVTGMTGSQGQPGMTGSQGQAGMPGSRGPGAPAGRWTSLKDISFDFDRAEIRPREMGKVSEIATYMNQNPSVRLGIDGSTDLLRGTNQYNVALSQQRVGNVRDALIRAGVSADRMEMGGFATQRAKCNDAAESCSQRDGQVEVLVRPSN